ncbi:MAG: DUF488 domain-containing protein [Caldilinea sp. CFX5]|nr:DUF488 domain-containing protein [Caldilinea sp. CFX5]
MFTQPPFTQSAIPIYTIGYGERTVAALVAVLQRYQIEYLVDVRTAPYSRYKPEFSKAELSAALRQQGFKYVFMGDQLGGRPTDPACYTDGKVDYDKVQATAAYQQGIERLHSAFVQQQRLVLMCSEGKPEQCHRSKLIGATLDKLGIPLVHIDENDAPQSQAQVIARLTDGQLSLFGDHSFQSRKRYPGAKPAQVEAEAGAEEEFDE